MTEQFTTRDLGIILDALGGRPCGLAEKVRRIRADQQRAEDSNAAPVVVADAEDGGPQAGDVVALLRFKDVENAELPFRYLKWVTVAALRQVGVLESDSPEHDARLIAEFKERGGEMAKPQFRVLGHSGWNA